MEAKICNKCKNELEIKFFQFKNKKENKRHTICSICQKQYKNKWYKNNHKINKNKFIERTKKNKEKKQQKLYEYLKDKSCIDCGENNILTLEFDHINPKDKIGNIGRMASQGLSWEKILYEINKCEIRCANCHRIKTAKQFSWQKLKF